MENPQELLERIAKKKSEPVIGKRKYNFLKSLDLENITDENLDLLEKTAPGTTVSEALKQMEAYEESGAFIPANYKPLPKKEIIEREPTKLIKEVLWNLFSEAFKKNEGNAYSRDKDSVENIKPLFYYFCGDLENFKKCRNVSLKSDPSLEKGLLIIGGYGNGKTSTMRALEIALYDSNVRFKGYSANDVVSMYESCTNEIEKKEFNDTMTLGTRYFDDVLTEREASNYGKVDLFKDILEQRYSKNKRTYITLNYKDDTGEDLDQGLAQLGERYGSRVYDRLYSMFNIVEFKGKSFRK